MTVTYGSNMRGQDFHKKMQKELSTYIEKIVNKDGSISNEVIQNPYFVVNDTWNIEFFSLIKNFKEQYKEYKSLIKNLRFSIKSSPINLEIKYLFYYKLFNDEWTLTGAFNKGGKYW